MICLTRREAESLVIGPDIRVRVLKITGRTVMLGVEAPDAVRVLRAEVLAANRAAALPPDPAAAARVRRRR